MDWRVEARQLCIYLTCPAAPETLVDSRLKQRSERLLEWERAPFARAVQPQEDHFLPLHVAVGAAEQEPAKVIYWQDDFFDKITMSSYRFGS